MMTDSSSDLKHRPPFSILYYPLVLRKLPLLTCKIIDIFLFERIEAHECSEQSRERDEKKK